MNTTRRLCKMRSAQFFYKSRTTRTEIAGADIGRWLIELHYYDIRCALPSNSDKFCHSVRPFISFCSIAIA
jgi:hypothetical protein